LSFIGNYIRLNFFKRSNGRQKVYACVVMEKMLSAAKPILHGCWQIDGGILKANLSWCPTSAKFCQLIASLSVNLPQTNLTKLKLE